MGDDRVAIRELCMGGCSLSALLQNERLERFDIIRKIRFALIHEKEGITKETA
jgi:hypothetical protein